MKTLLTLIALTLFSTSCTENQRAKSFGGEATVEVEAGQKLFDITWKDEDLWYATRPMREGETAETITFQEQSSFGLLEGTVIFKEAELEESDTAMKYPGGV
tara:strand:- start:4284 stop:4589 length:306 start_codon:yes stop_codon:yes gene_type:complete